MEKFNYRQIRGVCPYCVHCFTKFEYDQGPSLYCQFNAPDRPRCGPVCMPGERFGGDGPCKASEDEWNKDYEAWREWEAGRVVDSNGVCDKFSEGVKDGAG